MKLWLLSNDDYGGAVYDAYNGFLIAAETEEAAREIANDSAADEGTIWENPQKVSCQYIGEASPNIVEGIVISDYHAG